MSPECQAKNATGLTMVAVGVNKSAEQYLILDDQTKKDLADGKYRDQRRGSFGPALPSPATGAAAGGGTAGAKEPVPARVERRRSPASHPVPQRRPWSFKQRKLALLYNEQGLRPDEIARKIGLSSYLVSQIILTARNRGKL